MSRGNTTNQPIINLQAIESSEDLNLSQQVIYPTLNVYFSPRVNRNSIDHRNRSLCAYQHPIDSGETEYHNRPEPHSNELRQFQVKDGLIYQFSCLNRFNEEYNSPILKLKVLICICMYNESSNAIQITLEGIYKNLPKLKEQGIIPEEVGVVLIQDGILKLIDNRKTRTFAKGQNSMVHFYKKLDQKAKKPQCDLQLRIHTILDEMENINRKGPGMQRVINQNRDIPPTIQKNIALLYQNLWKPSMTGRPLTNQQQQAIPQEQYLRLFSCFKHTNGTKLSSHLWFFEGFCRYLNPDFIVLLDVGTVPHQEAIVNLLKGFDNPKVGGVTGLMTVDRSFQSEEEEKEKGKQEQNCLVESLRSAFFSVERAQEYEYIISHFYDKNAESTLGFLHVLPGAWSAYRYRALIKSDHYEANLLERDYFKMILNPDLQAKGHDEANMYLAEDRILSLGIYCQPGEQYYLRYIPNARAQTDPMKTHKDLMKQRRRWINSSMYAFLYVWKNYHYNANQSKHNGFDIEVKLNLSMLLSMLSLINTYLSPVIQFYVLYSTIYQIDPNQGYVFIIARVISALWIAVFLAAVGGSLLGNVWQNAAHYTSVVFALFNFGLLGLVVYNLVEVYLDLNGTGIDWGNYSQMSIFIMICINLGLYIILLLLHLPTHCGEVFRLITATISYISYQGAYMNSMVIYAFCNIDDVSWGTKGANKSGTKKYEVQKIRFVATWLFWNAFVGFLLIYIDEVIPNSQNNTGPQNNRRIVLICLAYYATFYLLLKALLAFYHQIKWLLSRSCECCCPTKLEPTRPERMRVLWEKLTEQYCNKVNARSQQLI